MDLKPLFDLAKKLKGRLLLIAIIFLTLLAAITWTFSKGSFDKLIANNSLSKE